MTSLARIRPLCASPPSWPPSAPSLPPRLRAPPSTPTPPRRRRRSRPWSPVAPDERRDRRRSSRSAASYFHPRPQQEHRRLQARRRQGRVRQGRRSAPPRCCASTVPAKLKNEFARSPASPMPTRFRIRVLAKKFGKRFTTTSSARRSSGRTLPRRTPPAPPSSARRRRLRRRRRRQLQVDTDDDNDLLIDDLETHHETPREVPHRCPATPTRTATASRTATSTSPRCDLNDDEYQSPNAYLPYPGKRPYPNPLDSGTPTSTTTATASRSSRSTTLWKYTYARAGRRTATLDAAELLGRQAVLDLHPWPRRPPRADLPPRATTSRPTSRAGRRRRLPTCRCPDGDDLRRLNDANGDYDVSTSTAPATSTRSATTSTRRRRLGCPTTSATRTPTASPTTTRRTADDAAYWWTDCYTGETPYPIAYAGTDLADPDSDGDGVRDGADDQDHDDIPNIMELSRNMATGRPFDDPKTKK